MENRNRTLSNPNDIRNCDDSKLRSADWLASRNDAFRTWEKPSDPACARSQSSSYLFQSW